MLEFFAFIINGILQLIKWPIAIFMALSTYKLFIIFIKIIFFILYHHLFYQSLFYGVFVYSFLWLFFFDKKNLGWFMVLEHELTHTIFAVLTFHKVVGLCATEKNGGIMGFVGGKGNWLIDLAPYFFPTLGVIVSIMLHFANDSYDDILIAILGFFIMYHIHSTIKEFSFKQPDIQEAGVIFSILFLPGANLLALIYLLSAIPNDGITFTDILFYLIKNCYHNISQFLLIIFN